MLDKILKNSSGFFTQQIFLVGTTGEDGKENFAPVSWVSHTLGPPACLILTLAGEKHTGRNFERTGQLSATVVTRDLMRFMETCGSPMHKERFFESEKVPFARGKVLDVPLIADGSWSFECTLFKAVKVGNAVTYFAEIKNVNVAEDIMALDFIDLRAIDPVLYSPGNYFAIGEHLGKIGDFSEKI
ncbi:MAG: flavin reductase family protein [Victivallaceae bacterium]|nr:flavin reductase [Victivallaceae bacterium]